MGQLVLNYPALMTPQMEIAMNDELMERQIKLEREMQTTGEVRYHKHVGKAKVMGLETSTKYGNSMLAEVVEPIGREV